MSKGTVAEWILRTVTTAENAAAILGDLIQRETTGSTFWSVIASYVLHALSARLVGTAIAVFLLQFVLFIVPAFVTMHYFATSMISIRVWYWCNVGIFLLSQFAIGLWIGRAKQDRSALLCALVVLFDCASGLLNLNNVSINMAAWAIPVLAGTVAYGVQRTRGRRSV